MYKEDRPGGPVVEELREEEASGGGGGAELGGRRYSNVSSRINSLFGIPSASTASMPVGMTATGSLELSDNMGDSKLPPDKGWHNVKKYFSTMCIVHVLTKFNFWNESLKK